MEKTAREETQLINKIKTLFVLVKSRYPYNTAREVVFGGVDSTSRLTTTKPPVLFVRPGNTVDRTITSIRHELAHYFLAPIVAHYELVRAFVTLKIVEKVGGGDDSAAENEFYYTVFSELANITSDVLNEELLAVSNYFDIDDERKRQAEEAMERLQEKFGPNVLDFAVTLKIFLIEKYKNGEWRPSVDDEADSIGMVIAKHLFFVATLADVDEYIEIFNDKPKLFKKLYEDYTETSRQVDELVDIIERNLGDYTALLRELNKYAQRELAGDPTRAVYYATLTLPLALLIVMLREMKQKMVALTAGWKRVPVQAQMSGQRRSSNNAGTNKNSTSTPRSTAGTSSASRSANTKKQTGRNTSENSMTCQHAGSSCGGNCDNESSGSRSADSGSGKREQGNTAGARGESGGSQEKQGSAGGESGDKGEHSSTSESGGSEKRGSAGESEREDSSGGGSERGEGEHSSTGESGAGDESGGSKEEQGSSGGGSERGEEESAASSRGGSRSGGGEEESGRERGGENDERREGSGGERGEGESTASSGSRSEQDGSGSGGREKRSGGGEHGEKKRGGGGGGGEQEEESYEENAGGGSSGEHERRGGEHGEKHRDKDASGGGGGGKAWKRAGERGAEESRRGEHTDERAGERGGDSTDERGGEHGEKKRGEDASGGGGERAGEDAEERAGKHAGDRGGGRSGERREGENERGGGEEESGRERAGENTGRRGDNEQGDSGSREEGGGESGARPKQEGESGERKYKQPLTVAGSFEADVEIKPVDPGLARALVEVLEVNVQGGMLNPDSRIALARALAMQAITASEIEYDPLGGDVVRSSEKLWWQTWSTELDATSFLEDHFLRGGSGYFYMDEPEFEGEERSGAPIPPEVITFVIDTSGSTESLTSAIEQVTGGLQLFVYDVELIIALAYLFALEKELGRHTLNSTRVNTVFFSSAIVEREGVSFDEAVEILSIKRDIGQLMMAGTVIEEGVAVGIDSHARFNGDNPVSPIVIITDLEIDNEQARLVLDMLNERVSRAPVLFVVITSDSPPSDALETLNKLNEDEHRALVILRDSNDYPRLVEAMRKLVRYVVKNVRRTI